MRDPTKISGICKNRASCGSRNGSIHGDKVYERIQNHQCASKHRGDDRNAGVRAGSYSGAGRVRILPSQCDLLHPGGPVPARNVTVPTIRHRARSLAMMAPATPANEQLQTVTKGVQAPAIRDFGLPLSIAPLSSPTGQWRRYLDG